MKVVALNQTLDQELLALSRGASLECLVCGEFVMRTELGIVCPECGSVLEGRAAAVAHLGVESG
ncbi:MAG TPA: hypothetical protein VHK22_09720 [Gaiellaceae bacterium]|jgi:Zn finger protein HypA/HybF involved in hydrogenase expression|nr:hypothetical protein [Gaiellaceae bacterium]